MEFGKVPDSELNKIDCKLPADPKATTEVLKKGKGNTKFYVGCAKGGRKDWVGKLYPPGTKEKDFFEHYAKSFNCIEFNAVFYRIPTQQQVQNWKSKVPRGFRFCPKYPQVVTHLKRLKNT